MKEKNFQTQSARERRSTSRPDTGTEPAHGVWPDAPLNASPESAPVSASDRDLDGSLVRDPGTGTGLAHAPRAAAKGKPGTGLGSLESFAPARHQLYAEAIKACHLEKRRGFREFVRGADPERDAEPATRPERNTQCQSARRKSRRKSCGRRPPEANAARLLDCLQGDPWQPGVPRSLETEREEQGRPGTLGKEEPKAQASSHRLAPIETSKIGPLPP